MFNAATKKINETEAEEFRAKVETLTLFCLCKYKTYFLLSPEDARRATRRLIAKWVKSGKIEKRLKQMWKVRKA